ncbi:MAG: cupin domain-containing protein [Candidatus Bathyarchaeia archaeon]
MDYDGAGVTMKTGGRSHALYYPHVDGRWIGIPVEPYKEERSLHKLHAKARFKGVTRHTLAAEQADMKFHVRYFEIEPGGYTTLERHDHVHVVIGKRGTGTVIAGDEVYTLREGDLLIIRGGAPHQLINPSDEPFGFYCIVDADRDRPRPITRKELEELSRSNPDILKIAKVP